MKPCVTQPQIRDKAVFPSLVQQPSLLIRSSSLQQVSIPIALSCLQLTFQREHEHAGDGQAHRQRDRVRFSRFQHS